MMKKEISRVLNVCAAQNKILIPVKKVFLSKIINQISFLCSVGPFYSYKLNFEDLKMEIVNDGIRDVVGGATDEFKMENVFSLIHPKDFAKLQQNSPAAIFLTPT